MVSSLWGFASNDNLKNYVFESDWIKALDFEGCEFSDELEEKPQTPVFKYKKRLSIARKPKKKGMVYLVLEEIIHEQEESGYVGESFECSSQEKVIDTFLAIKEELEFFAEKSKQNILFDCRRYFWECDDEGNILKQAVC